jgi:iron complex outermembrane recepter protein
LRVRIAACLLAGTVLMGAGEAQAEVAGPVCNLRITQTTLGPALGALAEQCGTPLLFPYDLAKTGGIHPVRGRRSIPEALKIMLRGTSLTGELTASGVITVSRSVDNGERDMTHNTRTGLLAGASALVMSLIGTNQVQAQDTKPAVIEEVIVTATKRAESVQDIPQSITAVSGRDLEAKGIENYEDLTRTIPGVIATGGSNFNKFVVRGIQTSNGTSSSGEQKLVAIYLDDLPLTSFSVLTPDVRPYDISRVEVLRGPQGTLFGSGSLAGAIRYVTNKADPTGYHASLDVEAGKTKGDSNRLRLGGMVNVPLIEDQLAVRLIGYKRNEDGWVNYAGANARKNTNTADDWGVRGSLRWQPNDKLNATFMVTSDHNRVGDSSLYDPTLGRNIAKRDFPFAVDIDLDSYNATVDYDLGFADLTSATVVAKSKTGWNLDLDAVLTAVMPFYFQEKIDTDSVVEDIRLVSKKGGKLDWVAGAFYLNQKSDYADSFNVPQSFLAALRITGLSPIRTPNADTSMDLRNKKNFEAALYGEASYHFTDSLTFTAGARASKYEFIDEDKGIGFTTPTLIPAIFTSIFGYGGANIAKVPSVARTNSTGKKSKLIGKFGLEWQPSADQTYYALASQGFRRSHPNGPSAANGGKSVINPNDPAIIPVMAEADSLWNYEIGAKNVWLDGRLRTTLAAYYIDWGPMQVPLVRSSDATPYVGTVGKARSIGLEGEVDALINEHVETGLNFTIQNAEVTKLTAAESLISGAVVGAKLASPEFKAGTYAKYGWTLADGSDLYARIDAQHVGAYVNTFPNTAGVKTPNAAYAKIPAYANVNVSVGWAKGNLKAVLYAENLGNNQSPIFIDAANYSLNRYGTLRPRTIGIRLGWKH